MQFIVAVVVTFMSIVCGPKTAMVTAVTPLASSTTSSLLPASVSTLTRAEVADSQKNMPAYANDGAGSRTNDETDSASGMSARNRNRRSYSASVGASLTAALNGLTKYTGLQHISTSYNPPATATAATPSTTSSLFTEQKQQIPIYEEQQENNYGNVGTTATAAAAATAAGASVLSENNEQRQNALRTTIYNLHEAGAHNNYVPRTSTIEWKVPGKSMTVGSAASWWPTSEPQQFLETNDKISTAGNFLHHYEHNNGYQHTAYEQQSAVQPEYFSMNLFQPHAPQNADEHLQWPLEASSYKDESTNYLPKPSEHEGEHTDAHSQQPDVINYVPYPVVKKLHVPVRQPIEIPVSHAVIMPVSKPVPIHIPVTQQVHIPVEKQLKIPIERVVPFPVEKHVPVPVEKRVPYPVIRYVPVKVPRPYPIKVPVYKTILHKMKSLW